MHYAEKWARLIFAVPMAMTWPDCAHAAEIRVKDVEQVEERLNNALIACDAGALGSLWDDSLSFVFPSGVVEGKPARIAGLSECVPGKQKSAVESVSTQIYGNTAVAIVLTAWKAEFNGKPFEAKFRATHVWHLQREGLVLIAAHVSQLKQ